jgi:phenylalanyl-tRNA synthetase beta subunit
MICWYLNEGFAVGRATEVVFRKLDDPEIVLGCIGVLHLDMLVKFDLNMPCYALEINYDMVVCSIKIVLWFCNLLW